MSKKVIVGMTGATGAIFGIEILRKLLPLPDIETHLVLSQWAKATIHLETGLSVREVTALADVSYSAHDQGAAISSGSFPVHGMIVAPCSMKTLAGIRAGYADGLVSRAADVTLKEGRRLVLMPRETPLSELHLENMLALARMGVRIVPPMPAFYNLPKSVDEVVDHLVVRVLDQLDIQVSSAGRWTGMPTSHSLIAERSN
ncbi:UbiX family flavin prenyltransferase [Streptomyces sp. NPDC059224]|uniref:UbiX family flavin prenyltransferase n=1 Tax=Streptomyces sp. NPDC059224 TaxID=3346775 RepID=UPI0036C5DFFC